MSLVTIPGVSGIRTLNAPRASSPGQPLACLTRPGGTGHSSVGLGGCVSGWHLAVPPEHFQATCGFWMWEVPLMQAGVRGILFNVLGGGREGQGNREGRA